MRTVRCPMGGCGYTYSYDDGDVAALRAESEVGIERHSGYPLLAVIEFPLREHLGSVHNGVKVPPNERSRWFL